MEFNSGFKGLNLEATTEVTFNCYYDMSKF